MMCVFRLGVARAASLAASLGLLFVLGCIVQIPDPYFEPQVPFPAYSTPVIGIDTTHNNFHQSQGRYRPFADLLIADGYQVKDFNTPFGSDCLVDPMDCEFWDALAQVDILVISNAQDVISQEEADEITLWVSQGRSLLLVQDHLGFDTQAATLRENLGVGLGGGGNWVYVRSDPDPTEGTINGSHPIANGSGPSEVVNEVATFGGRGLTEILPPPSSASLEPLLICQGGGSFMGVAITYGSGRAYVAGEAAWSTNQIKFNSTRSGQELIDLCTTEPFPNSSRQCELFIAEDKCAQSGVSPDDCADWMHNLELRFGLIVSDNQQFLLNIVHWLDGLL